MLIQKKSVIIYNVDRVAPEKHNAQCLPQKNIGKHRKARCDLEIFNVNEEFLKEKGFLFINIEIIEYFKEQITNGKYIDNGFCDWFYLDTYHKIKIDNLEFKDGNTAYNYFLHSEYYTVKEEIILYNGCQRRKKVEVYRNKELFDINNFYDIVMHIKQISGVNKICFDDLIVLDVKSLNGILKGKDSYTWRIKSFIRKLNDNNKKLEQEISEQKNKNSILRNKNKKLHDENKELKERIKHIENKENILDKKSKKLLETLISITNELEKNIN